MYIKIFKQKKLCLKAERKLTTARFSYATIE